MTYLSAVIPVYNEEESLPRLLAELREYLSASHILQPYEVIVVNDGSTDSGLEAVDERFKGWEELKIINSRRNLGQTAALSLGFKESRGSVVVALDADGQNKPSDIGKLVQVLEDSGVDCVSGWRRSRTGDRGLRLGFSRVANELLRKASKVDIHDSGCTLKAYKGSVVRRLGLYGDMHRLLPFQIELGGGLVMEEEVSHRPRFGGTSKYTLARTFRVLQDIVAAFFLRRFMYRPMHLIGSVGLTGVALGFLGLAVAMSLKIFGFYDLVETPMVLVSSVLIIGGINLLGTGLLGELLTRFFVQSGLERFPFARQDGDDFLENQRH